MQEVRRSCRLQTKPKKKKLTVCVRFGCLGVEPKRMPIMEKAGPSELAANRHAPRGADHSGGPVLNSD
ncbi:hypothetical protein GCM10022295_93530 [Streptomyces osmaniensis]|uniref:Uncharacterized protein n=1 Tax=Streptomyces osmaniensis TaxID=593134 RepID=A0ABP6ZBQ1_9ACTN